MHLLKLFTCLGFIFKGPMKVGKKNHFAFSAPLYCYKIIVLHITFHLPPKIFHVSTKFFSIRVCSVGGKIERMKKERERERERERENGWEKCLIGRGRRREFWWSTEIFSPTHQNKISPNWRENGRENCAKMPTSKPTVYVLLPIVSYSFF